MVNNTNDELHIYYNERAGEYDEVYQGKGTIIPCPELYKNDAVKISEFISTFGKGHLIDIGCGTGFWLPYYHKNCESITLLDSSINMIEECKRRASGLGILPRCLFLQQDFFSDKFENTFDSVVIGHVLCHFKPKQEHEFFEILKHITSRKAQILIIDSLWNDTRKGYRSKEGMQERTLRSGQKFKVFKKYYSQNDIEEIFKDNNYKIVSFFSGNLDFAAIGEEL
jgi:cyclopropane fatty-acyl-phospholipid synthase-like methyltransferase